MAGKLKTIARGCSLTALYSYYVQHRMTQLRFPSCADPVDQLMVYTESA
jgi:hypothetical protein